MNQAETFEWLRERSERLSQVEAALREATAAREAAERRLELFRSGDLFSTEQTKFVEANIKTLRDRAEAAEAALAAAREALEAAAANLYLHEETCLVVVGRHRDIMMPDVECTCVLGKVEAVLAALQDEATA